MADDPFTCTTRRTRNRADLIPSLEEEVHVWVLDPDTADDAMCTWCEGVLSEREDERRRKFIRDVDGRSYLLAHGFVRAVLSRYGEVPATSWTFAEGAQGRPEIAHPSALTGLRFNLSHTRGQIALLVHGVRDAGIDVERLDRVEDPVALSRRFFTSEEHEGVASLVAAERDAQFVRLWTLKEAYVKARGLSLAENAKKFWFEAGDPSDIRVHINEDLGDDGSGWSFTASPSGSKHVLATAARRSADGCARTVRYFT